MHTAAWEPGKCTGKWERVQLAGWGPVTKDRTGTLLSKEQFQGPFMEGASVDTKIMGGVDHRS